MQRTQSGKILLHTDGSLSRELAEEINQAVGKIGPIEVAGMGVFKRMEHATGAIEEGLEKMEQAHEQFKEAVPDSILEKADAADPALATEVDQLRRENKELREKLKNSVVKK